MDIPYLQNKRRVLVQLAEDIAIDTPARVYAVVPRTENVAEGFTEISYRQAIDAVNYIGHWLKSVLGNKPDRAFETLTYFGVSDLRYTLLTLACIKCGYKILLPSPRNSVSVNLSLMNQVDSSKIIYSSELGKLSESLISTSPELQTYQIPSFEEIIAGRAETIPYNPSFEEAIDHPVVVLHSSGSTGPPKPITFTNGSIATLGADWEFKVPNGRKIVGLPLFVSNGRECRYFGPMPPFHLGGLYYRTIAPIYSLAVPIYQPAARLPNAELVMEILQHQKVQAVVLPPSLIEGLLHVPGGMAYLKQLDWIMFSGGALSQVAGDQIRKHTTLIPYYGSTELLAIRQLTPEPENWSYHEFHPDDHFRMEHFDEDVYELVALPDPEAGPSNPGSAAFVHSLPGTNIYHTKDLFRKHPDRDLWQFFGRRDDIIVLSSGEKINPGPFEVELRSDAVIADTVMVGSGRTRPALLVEVSSEGRRAPDLAERVWRAVRRANATASGPSRVARELVLITDAERLFVRTGKGSVVRKSSVAAYEQDIEDLYSKFNSTGADARKISFKECNQAEMQDLIRSVVVEVMTTPPTEDSTNLYLLGLDSLSTVDVIKALSYRIGNEPWLVPNILYTNPSIEALASAIVARYQGRTAENDASRPGRLRDTLASLISDFPSVDDNLSQDKGSNYVPKAKGKQGLTVVVTGTTGSLGSALVESLLDTSNIERVICLNRSSKAEAQWNSRPASPNSPQHNTVPVTFHTIDFTDARLALADDDLRQIETCDIFIHNAWRVDFNLDLSSFQDSLQGLRNILDITTQAEAPPKLVFISSISSVSSLPHVLEHAIQLETACVPMGYAESKWIAERMIDRAAAQAPEIHALVLRIDQIAGSQRPGAGGVSWPATDAFPGIMQTCRFLGLIPDDLPAVNWIPMDEVVRCILELSISERTTTGGGVRRGEAIYYNVTNPHATEWSVLLDPLREYCGGKAELVDLRTWVDALARFDCADKRELARKPALKVMGFMRHLAENGVRHERRVDVGKSTSQSPSLAAMKPIGPGELRQWLASL